MSKLITPSLFGAIDWYTKAPSGWKERAYDSLYGTLARKYGPPAAAALRGIKFEDTIYKTLETRKELHDLTDIKCSAKFMEFLVACLGGMFQVKSKSFIEVDGVEYCLYGKIDVLYPHMILDIKTTSKWNQFSEDKYLGSMQHIIYLYNQNMEHFRYMIAVFDGEDSVMIKEIKFLDYHEKFKEKLRGKIIIEIQKQNQFLKEHPALKDLYHTTYCKY